MPLEPYTLAAFIVTVASTVTATAAVWAARYVREAKLNSEQSLRILRGEKGVDDQGLVWDVRQHRKALIAAGLYPPHRYDADGEHDLSTPEDD